MDCIINRGIFLRANGTMPCWCDGGISINLQSFDRNRDYAKDVFLGPTYTRIRESLKNNHLPFADACSRCAMLEPNKTFDPGYAGKKIVEVIQVEPSMACQLECPSCWPKKDRPVILPRTDAGHLILDPAVLEKVLTDLKAGGVTVRNFMLVGHGDPLANRHTWQMIAFIRKTYPECSISMTTHANYEFRPEMLDAGLTELICSIDGVDQESYEKYRIGGRFDRAYRFMKDFATAARRAGKPHIVTWNYIVFAHNDTPEQLLRAQELAREAEVSRLIFTITWLGPASNRVYSKEEIPILPGTLPIQIASNKVSAEELKKQVADLRQEIARGNTGRSVEIAAYMVSMYERLFAGGNRDVPRRYFDVLADLASLAESLPQPERDRVLIAHDNVVKHNRVDSPGPVRLLFDGSPDRVPLDGLEEGLRTVRQALASGDHGQASRAAASLASAFRRMASGGGALPAGHYRVLRGLLEVPAVLTHAERAELLIVHDDLVRTGHLEITGGASLLFDEGHYLGVYPDVAAAVQAGHLRDGYDHFVRWGRSEGRQPSPSFGHSPSPA